MLIRWATEADKDQWLALSKEYDADIAVLGADMARWYDGFDDYMDRKIAQSEAVVAVDRMSGRCNGLIAFSRKSNRITFFAVGESADFPATADRLLLVALRQLDTNADIAAQTPMGGGLKLKRDKEFFEGSGFVNVADDAFEQGVRVWSLVRKADDKKRGHSFHYRYPQYAKEALQENCPACNSLPMPDGLLDIAELDCAFATAERAAQGKLFGKCHVLAKRHNVLFYDMPEGELLGFMRDVQRVARALHEVTGAVKINYEIHGNSGAHLHVHLFPRYLDDDFPGAPIDYRVTEPSPYESQMEFDWFVERMRERLRE